MEDRLRICLIALMYFPLVGGAEVRAAKYAQNLQEQGHTVTIVTLKHHKDWAARETIDGIDVVRVGGVYKRDGTLRIGRVGHFPPDMGVFWQLWSMRHDYDLFYNIEMSTLAGVSILVGKLAQKPVVVSIPSTGYGRTLRPDEAMLMADSLPASDALKVRYHDTVAGDIASIPKTTVGGHVMLNFIKKSAAYYQILSTRGYSYLTSLGFKSEQIVYIPGGVDVQKFHPAPELRPDVTKPERDILCVARLEYPKGIDVLLHAWYRMLHAPSSWRAQVKPRLLIVGTGALQEQLQWIARELDLQESVKFIGLHYNVVQLLQQAWGFVLPSRWEGLPNALLEAMACGLPCVATRVSGSEDLIQNDVNGLLVENEQPADMARALQRIIEDPALAQRLGDEARATVVRDYQIAHVTRKTVDLYRHLLDKGTQPRPLALKGTAQ